jgi:hypothetical protein
LTEGLDSEKYKLVLLAQSSEYFSESKKIPKTFQNCIYSEKYNYSAVILITADVLIFIPALVFLGHFETW